MVEKGNFEDLDNTRVVMLISLGLCQLLNILTVLILYPSFFYKESIIRIFYKALHMELAYQEIQYIIAILLICTVMSMIYPCLVKYFYCYTFLRLNYEKIGKMNGLGVFLCVLLEIIPVIIAAKYADIALSYIKIDEVCRKYEMMTDEEITEESYIVLYNDGELSQKLSKIQLSINEDLSDSLVFENIVIPAKGTIGLRKEIDKGLEIKKKGGTTIYLALEDGEILDYVEVGALAKNESYKRIRNTDEEWEVCKLDFDIEVPLADTVETIVNAPILSHESGFYDEEFLLTIKADEGTKIYYTLDGSNPTEESIEYTGPIRVYNRSDEENVYRSMSHVIPNYLVDWKQPDKVDKVFIVRAVCEKENGKCSEVVTKTYIVGLTDKYGNNNVISIVTDADNLFGEDGIFVTGQDYDKQYLSFDNVESRDSFVINNKYSKIPNYNKRGKQWERDASFEYMNRNNKYSQNIGIRVQGASTRLSPTKRLSLYSRKEYSEDRYFGYDFFNDKLNHHSMVLREGFLNAFCMDLVPGRDISTLSSIPVTVFINGEYWYDVYLQERYTEDYFAEHYKLNKDNIIISKANMINELKSLFERCNLATAEGYVKFQEYVDVQSYIDCYATNMYLGNTDLLDNKNVVMWKTDIKENDDYGDARWRWCLYDMDLGIGGLAKRYNLGTNAEFNTFASVSEANTKKAFNESEVFQSLKHSSDFCKEYVITFMDMANTYFTVENMTIKLEEWGQNIGYNQYYFRDRSQYITKYLAQEFNLTGTQQVVNLLQDDIDSGNITLNTITPELLINDSEEDIQAYTWSGNYFTDYPVTVTANESEGHTFKNWIVTSNGVSKTYTDKTIEVPVVEGGVEIYAVFE